MDKRQLVLEDGTVFTGKAFGSEINTSGEVVFNTGMTGYQEIISDPSYCGQIVTMTYPLIGNYGINRDDFETIMPSIKGLVVKEHCVSPSNFRAEESIDSLLKFHEIPGISGIDTRKLTKLIRNHGTLRGMFTDASANVEESIAELKAKALLTNQVERVSTVKPYVVPGRGKRIVLVDFGMKHSILRELTKRDCHITVVPYNYTTASILRLKPDGVVLSNGPGNPKNVPEAIKVVAELVNKLPIFGICLGHQLFALACGADTEKMKFGHRGTNQPVKDLERNKTYITSQNHGYSVKKDSLQNTELELTQIALNDGTVEGVKHKYLPAFSVQYHPESAPGPEDTNYLFDSFLQLITENKLKIEEEKRCLSVQI